MEKHQGLILTEMSLDENVEDIPVPYPGSEYKCPNCEQDIPTRKQINLAKPAKYSHTLNDIQKCPFCSFIFSYRSRALVLRQ